MRGQVSDCGCCAPGDFAACGRRVTLPAAAKSPKRRRGGLPCGLRAHFLLFPGPPFGGYPHNQAGEKAPVTPNCPPDPPPGAFWFLCRRGQRNSPPAGGESPRRKTPKRPDEGIGPYKCKGQRNITDRAGPAKRRAESSRPTPGKRLFLHCPLIRHASRDTFPPRGKALEIRFYSLPL